jgi:hypothetical protein
MFKINSLTPEPIPIKFGVATIQNPATNTSLEFFHFILNPEQRRVVQPVPYNCQHREVREPDNSVCVWVLFVACETKVPTAVNIHTSVFRVAKPSGLVD